MHYLHNFSPVFGALSVELVKDHFVDNEPPFRLLLSFSIKKERPGLERIPNPVSVECSFVTLPVYVEPFSRHNPVAVAVLYGTNPVAVTTFWT